MSQFRKLPPDIRMLPTVSDAWHMDHADRLDRIEAKIAEPPPTPPIVPLTSPPSTAAAPAPTSPQTLLPVGYMRPALLLLTIGVVTGKITVEQAMTILRFVFGLPE